MKSHEAEKFLLQREICVGPFGLHRIGFLCEKLGNPQLEYPVVLVGGTNGKGSVTAILESVFRAAQTYQTGTMISPHLFSLHERIRLNGDFLPGNLLSEGLSAMMEFIRIMEKEPSLGPPSFFELITAIGFLTFRETLRDIALVEVGMGGRLDATNISSPEVSVITNIGTDHKEQLGDTREKIAVEKLGIIRKKRPLVTGEKDPVILEIFKQKCAEKGAVLVHASDSKLFSLVSSHPRGHRIEISGSEIDFPLAGSHQLENLAVALATIRELRNNGFEITPKQLSAGISSATWPGRLQWVDHSPPVLLDGAHNHEGLISLSKYLDEFPLPQPAHIILGTLRDKPFTEMASLLSQRGVQLTFVPPPCRRSLSKSEFEESIKATDHRWEWADDLDSAIKRVPSAASVLVTGSLYLISDFIRKHCKKPNAG